MKRISIGFILSVLLICSSCVSSKKMIYLQGADYLKDNPQAVEQRFELKIQPDDQLAISISSKDKELIEPFNNNTLIGSGNTVGMNNQSNMQAGIAYFQVDKDGFIEFPVFGKLKVVGLTRNQFAKLLNDKLINQLIRAVCDDVVNHSIEPLTHTEIGRAHV